jgi:16S rRNA (uracil1498-N3)-methyltransferase
VRRLPLSDLRAGDRVLDEDASRYLARVLRLEAGAALEVFDPKRGLLALARVAAVDRDAARLVIEEPHEDPTPERPAVLVQGYPKGDKLADVVRDATELGATLIVPAIATRSIARPDDAKGPRKLERLEAVAAEAARQCGRARAPTLSAPLPWDEALRLARAALGEQGRGFVLWERATSPLGPDLLAAAREALGVAFVIGPEGGLEADEVARAEALGFVARGLGTPILRTETVAAAALGALAIMRSA